MTLLAKLALCLGIVVGVAEDAECLAARHRSREHRTAGAALLQLGIRTGLAQTAQLESPEVAPSHHVQYSLGASESGRVLGSALQKSAHRLSGLAARSGMYVAHQAYLRRALQVAEAGRNASNNELDTLITNFIEAHTASEDHCPAELLEAKHQLNSLHQMILTDLAGKVNSTEAKILKDNGKLNKTVKEVEDLDNKKVEDDKKLAEKKAETCRMLETLKNESRELRAIAQPQVTMNITGRDLQTGGGPLSLTGTSLRLSLLQDASAPRRPAAQDKPPQAVQVKLTQDLLRRTTDAAKEVLYCEEQSGQMLVQVSAEQVAAPQSLAEVGSLAPNGTNCTIGNGSTNLSASVTVGDLTMLVAPPGDITDGFYRATNCSSVNPKYGGAIWLHCNNGSVTADARGCISLGNATNCTLQKNNLEKAYVKAYVELARLIDEYEQQCSSTDEQDALDEEHKEKKDPLQDEADALAVEVKDNTKGLQDLQPKLQDALIAEGKLRAHVQALSTQCSALNATESSLDEVRAAIHALEACPGLVRPEFHIPEWVGNWTTFMLDDTKSDVDNDVLMLAACQLKFGVQTRPAEVGEIEATSIEGMPRNNSATVALVGACPKCVGKSDADSGMSTFEGHARVCWFPGQPLLAANRADCSRHQKAIMCVTDRGDLRKIVWTGNHSATPSSPP